MAKVVRAAPKAIPAAIIRKGAPPARKMLPLSWLADVTRPIAVMKLSCAAIIRLPISEMLHIRFPPPLGSPIIAGAPSKADAFRTTYTNPSPCPRFLKNVRLPKDDNIADISGFLSAPQKTNHSFGCGYESKPN
jgi:hypothetical protein